jgi:enolase
MLTAAVGEWMQVVGDDLLVTDPDRIRAAAREELANAALIKPNQIGTVSETLEALAAAREAGWGAMISHRSGETTDTFIADLAVAAGVGQLKTGAPARGERVAKYNRLLEIEATSGQGLPYGLAY